MYRKHALIGLLVAGALLATSLLAPDLSHAQGDTRVQEAMLRLKDTAAKLGTPKLEGKEVVGGKDAPALYFGSTKINNNFDIVDTVSKEDPKAA